MSIRKLLTDSVVLFNYLGEINDEAAYQKTIIRRCCCQTKETVDTDTRGRKSNESGTVYIFDEVSVAETERGRRISYLPYEKWVELSNDDKRNYWTISSSGSDFFRKHVSSSKDYKLTIVGFCKKEAGSRRMHHLEVYIE